MLNIAVLAPMPSPRVMIAMSVNPGTRQLAESEAEICMVCLGE